MDKHASSVLAFMEKHGQPVAGALAMNVGGGIPPHIAEALKQRAADFTAWLAAAHKDYPSNDLLRCRLMIEEAGETVAAIANGDIVEVADGLADQLYVVHGTALAYGVPLDAVFDEVHRSNMTKAALATDGKGGKVDKAGYSPAQVGTVLFDHEVRKAGCYVDAPGRRLD